MKKILFTLAVLTGLHGIAQQQPNQFPRTINVNGSAEMEVIPDEIYVRVDLQEYERKGNKKTLDEIKSSFISSLHSIGINDTAISVDTYQGYNPEWWRKHKKDKENLMASVSYEIKLNSVAKLGQLVNVLDDDATSSFVLTRTSHSRMNEFRKQLKIQAVKAAREKAEYLAGALDEKVGNVVSISEPNEGWTSYPPLSFANTTVGLANDENPSIDFRKMKLRFEVNVVFGLK